MSRLIIFQKETVRSSGMVKPSKDIENWHKVITNSLKRTNKIHCSLRLIRM